MPEESIRKKMEATLGTLEPISLAEMDSSEIVSRYDTKYFFSQEHLLNILSKATNDYYILEIAGKRIHCYNNLYFDTLNYQLFLEHHNRRANRLKIRYRKYADSGIT